MVKKANASTKANNELKNSLENVKDLKDKAQKANEAKTAATQAVDKAQADLNAIKDESKKLNKIFKKKRKNVKDATKIKEAAKAEVDKVSLKAEDLK